MKHLLFWLVACSALSFSSYSVSDNAQFAINSGDSVSQNSNVCEPFKNRTISIIVGFKAGGGFDRAMREFAPVLERISGMDVRVVNKPGGGSLGVMNQVKNAAESEFRIGYFSLEPLLIESLIAKNLAELDDLNVFGYVVKDRGVWIAKREIDWNNPPSNLVAGLSSSAVREIGLVAMTMDLPVSYVYGIHGSSQAALSLARGDIDLAYLSLETALRLKNSFPNLIISLIIDDSADPRLPETRPLTGPYGIVSPLRKSQFAPERSDLAELAVALGGLTRVLVAGGGLDDDENQCLSASVNAALFDPAFKSAMAQQKLEYAPRQRAEVEQAFTNMLELVEKHHDVLIKISSQ